MKDIKYKPSRPSVYSTEPQARKVMEEIERTRKAGQKQKKKKKKTSGY